MTEAGRQLLERLPAGLIRQSQLLWSIGRFCAEDDGVNWLCVGCSIVRGNSDPLSDLDLAIGTSEDQSRAVMTRLLEKTSELGEVVGHYDSAIGEQGRHRRLFVQYADRCQLDIVLTTDPDPHLFDVVALYDPAARVHCLEAPRLAENKALDRYFGEGLEALLNVGKYLRRGALWEARAQLEAARGHLFQLLAAVHLAPRAEFGLTALFDLDPVPDLPAGIEKTLAGLEYQGIAEAARSLAEIMTLTAGRLSAADGWEPPLGFARFVMSDLRALLDRG